MQSSLNYILLYSHMDNTNSKSVSYNPKGWLECPLKDSLSYRYLEITFYGRNCNKFHFCRTVKCPQKHLHSGATYQAKNYVYTYF